MHCICSYSWPGVQIPLVVSMSRSEGLFNYLARFFFNLCICYVALGWWRLAPYFPDALYFWAIERVLAVLELTFFNVAFEVWALFAGILKRGRRKFICFDKQGFRKNCMTLHEEELWWEGCLVYLFYIIGSGKVS